MAAAPMTSLPFINVLGMDELPPGHALTHSAAAHDTLAGDPVLGDRDPWSGHMSAQLAHPLHRAGSVIITGW